MLRKALLAGIIASRWQPYIWTSLAEGVTALLVVGYAFRDLFRNATWPRFWLWNALLALVVFVFGRVLSPNYFDLVVTLLLLALVSWLVDRGKSMSRDELLSLLHFTWQELKESPLPPNVIIPDHQPDEYLLALFDFPLRVCAWLSQMRAGMWVRNGL